MTTKSDIINEAYAELRISGLTVDPSSEDVTLALNKLEAMMSELFYQWNLDVGYNFEETPTTTSETQVPLRFKRMMETNLARRLISAFNKQPPQTLIADASSSLSNAIGFVAQNNVRQIQPPRRMPVGRGNDFRNVYWDRYSVPTDLPPAVTTTNVILKGETLDYREDYSAFLGTATISSFSITVDDALTLDSSTNNDPIINYTITARDNDSDAVWQRVKISITDSLGRTEIRLIDFELQSVPDVG